MTNFTALNLSRTHLDDLCEKWVQENLKVLGVDNAADALKLLTTQVQNPDRTAKTILPISFSVFALRTFAMIVRELTQKQRVSVYHVPRGNGGLDHLRLDGAVFFSDQDYQNEEYLVDYYVSPVGKKLCPLLTMESEAKTDPDSLAFKDLDKLLSVSSPRRIYFGQIRSAILSNAEAVISSRLSSAYQSQVVSRGDQIAIILNVIGGDEAGFKFYSFDVEKRLCSENYIHTATAFVPDSGIP